MMYAVIRTGGKQYRVAEGDEITIEKLAAEEGDSVLFDHVLMIGGERTAVGTPHVEGAGVTAEVLEQGRGPKVYSFKRRRRKHSSKRLKGHRQDLTTVRITGIVASGAAETGLKTAVGAAQQRRAEHEASKAAAA